MAARPQQHQLRPAFEDFDPTRHPADPNAPPAPAMPDIGRMEQTRIMVPVKGTKQEYRWRFEDRTYSAWAPVPSSGILVMPHSARSYERRPVK